MTEHRRYTILRGSVTLGVFSGRKITSALKSKELLPTDLFKDPADGAWKPSKRKRASDSLDELGPDIFESTETGDNGFDIDAPAHECLGCGLHINTDRTETWKKLRCPSCAGRRFRPLKRYDSIVADDIIRRQQLSGRWMSGSRSYGYSKVICQGCRESYDYEDYAKFDFELCPQCGSSHWTHIGC
jgi:Zn finger protein HypA/HybF involved in hydrogenase expression